MWYKVKATCEWLVKASSEEEAEEKTDEFAPDTIIIESVEEDRHETENKSAGY